MGQETPEIDDVAQIGNAGGVFGMAATQAVQGLADDLELALDRGRCQSVPKVGVTCHTAGEALDVPARLFDIRQQDAGVTMHIRSRATC